MTPDVRTASPDTTLAEALSLTLTHCIRHLPILSDGRLVGLVTDVDWLAMPRIRADEHDELMQTLHTRRGGEPMITEIVTVQRDTPVENPAQLLYTHHIGCLPVLEDDRRVPRGPQRMRTRAAHAKRWRLERTASDAVLAEQRELRL